MRRLLAVPFSCVLLGGLLLAVDECPKPPSPSKQCPTMTNGCPGDVSDGVCRVRLDFFNEYQNCVGPDPMHPHVHAPIQIAEDDYLLITNGDGSSIQEKFSVGKFTEYTKTSGDDCDESGPKDTHAVPFYEPQLKVCKMHTNYEQCKRAVTR